MILGADFGKRDPRTVLTSLWNSDNPGSNTWVSWKLLRLLVENESMQKRLFGFLKHVLKQGVFLSLWDSIYCKVYIDLSDILAH